MENVEVFIDGIGLLSGCSVTSHAAAVETAFGVEHTDMLEVRQGNTRYTVPVSKVVIREQDYYA